MLLEITTHNIKYIALDCYCEAYSWSPNYVAKNDLKDYVRVTNFGYEADNQYYRHVYGYRWESSKYTSPKNAKGIYLGETSDITNEINKKLNPADPSTFKKVYFDSNCKYPRFKLNSLTDIKRCLDFTKADSVIISQPKFTEYKMKSYVSTNIVENVLILYSVSENAYYFIDYYPDKLLNKKEDPKFQALISKYADLQTTGLRRWISALLGNKILPADCKEFYYGKVVLADTTNDIQFIDNLFTKYMLLTYDTELDRFISIGLQQPTIEDIETMGRMFSSTDNSVVGMGLKLLSNYDVSTSICAIGVLIAQNWGNIATSSVSKSTGFEQVLRTLGLNKSELNRYDTDGIINTLYKSSTDEADKEKARNVIKQKIAAAIQKDWESTYSKKFTNLGFTFKFTIE